MSLFLLRFYRRNCDRGLSWPMGPSLLFREWSCSSLLCWETSVGGLPGQAGEIPSFSINHVVLGSNSYFLCMGYSG